MPRIRFFAIATGPLLLSVAWMVFSPCEAAEPAIHGNSVRSNLSKQARSDPIHRVFSPQGRMNAVTTSVVQRAAGDSTDCRPRLERAVTATFSIVAADPETGVCGAAVASRYPAVGKVVPYVRAGVGAFCTQHWHNPAWGEKALDLLQQGQAPEDVIAALLRDDKSREKRQLAIIDMKGRAVNRNPSHADPSGVYWGGMTGRYYACQGNTLTGRDVVVAMARAYEETHGSLADRLMAALVAGDCAGGDHRGRLAAGIRVAKRGVKGCWLELNVDKSDDAVRDLARKYAELAHEAKGDWPGGKLPFKLPCPKKVKPVLPE